jgi:hypothetical protein
MLLLHGLRYMRERKAVESPWVGLVSNPQTIRCRFQKRRQSSQSGIQSGSNQIKTLTRRRFAKGGNLLDERRLGGDP